MQAPVRRCVCHLVGGVKQMLLAAVTNSVLVNVQVDQQNRNEARMWLVANLAAMPLEGSRSKRRKFAALLQRGGVQEAPEQASKDRLRLQLLQLLCEQHPAEVAQLLLQETDVLRRFFEGERRRIMLWFGHFSMAGLAAFRFGAAALAKYALAEREHVWHLLEWEGKCAVWF